MSLQRIFRPGFPAKLAKGKLLGKSFLPDIEGDVIPYAIGNQVGSRSCQAGIVIPGLGPHEIGTGKRNGHGN